MGGICLYEEKPRILSNFGCGKQTTNGSRQALFSGTALVVDDDIGQHFAARVALRSLFDRIITFFTSEEAIKYLYEDFENVVFILSDINLPKMSGLEFLSEVKQNNAFKHIPVIIHSGNSSIDSEEVLGRGAACFLRKPYTKQELHSAIYRLEREKLLKQTRGKRCFM